MKIVRQCSVAAVVPALLFLAAAQVALRVRPEQQSLCNLFVAGVIATVMAAIFVLNIKNS